MASDFAHGSLVLTNSHLAGRREVLKVRSAEKRLQTVIVFMADRVRLEVMAPDALETEPE